MRPRQPSSFAILLGVAASAAWMLAGCGSPAPPMPPSLKLPRAVADLTADRVADTVTLRWTMPAETTDKLPLKGLLETEICRRMAGGSCVPIKRLQLAAGKAAEVNDALGADADAGAPVLLSYSVSVFNNRHRAAGASNPAYVAGGAAPAPPTELTATASKRGVVLRWQAAAAAPQPTEFLAERTLVASAGRASGRATASRPASARVGGAAAAPAVESLRIPLARPGDAAAAQDTALDASARFGDSYRYTLQSVAAMTLLGHAASSRSAPSNTVGITPVDTFPPSRPRGLEVALTPPATAAAAYTVDLSWTPNTEPDLAGYIVYRREAAEASPVRISPADPLPAPAFTDANALAGKTYVYSVSAVDADGNQSERSTEHSQSVPPA